MSCGWPIFSTTENLYLTGPNFYVEMVNRRTETPFFKSGDSEAENGYVTPIMERIDPIVI